MSRWSKAIKNAQLELKKNKIAIENTKSGIPSGKLSDHRVGKSPSSFKGNK